jgi:anti-sigma B factor antagonist
MACFPPSGAGRPPDRRGARGPWLRQERERPAALPRGARPHPKELILVADAERPAGPVVVALPAEIDISNSGKVATQLHAAIAPGAGVVVADLSMTTFCDSSGVRVLVLARGWAAAAAVQLQLVASAGPTLTVLEITGLDRLVPVFPTLREALAAGQPPDPGAGPPSAG